MDDRIYFINLYDYYSELLTDKQQNYFEGYYFDNLSLQEISENIGVSRNAVSKQLKDVTNKLEYFEEKLKLYNKSLKIKKLIEKIDFDTKSKIEELI